MNEEKQKEHTKECIERGEDERSCTCDISDGDNTTNNTLEKMLIEDNKIMRKAGCELAEAAIYSIREYDGLHRLSLAVSKWAEVIAGEGHRSALSPLQEQITKIKE